MQNCEHSDARAEYNALAAEYRGREREADWFYFLFFYPIDDLETATMESEAADAEFAAAKRRALELSDALIDCYYYCQNV